MQKSPKLSLLLISIFILIPLCLFPTSIIWWTIYEHSSVKITEQNADKLIEAINNYRMEVGFYPMELESLSPNYIEPIPPILSAKGIQWLYKTEDDYFLLGYIRYNDKLAYQDCVYNSINRRWECGIYEWEKTLSSMPNK